MEQSIKDEEALSGYLGRIVILPQPEGTKGVSSSLVRERMLRGESSSGLLCPEVGGLPRYHLEDGRLLPDNNLAENEIRPVTLGRKNYIFCGNHEAAGSMAVICSLLATCRNHDVNPRDYLNDVISQMPYHANASYEELLQLLSHRWKLTHPESVMTKTA